MRVALAGIEVCVCFSAEQTYDCHSRRFFGSRDDEKEEDLTQFDPPADAVKIERQHAMRGEAFGAAAS